MRGVRQVSVAVLGSLVMATTAFAQSFERGWIDVNFGVAGPAQDNFDMRGTRTIFSERATFGADYNLPTGAAFDFGGGFMITPIIGVGVSFTGTAEEDVVELSATVPHPNFFNSFASDTAATEDKLARTEGGVHVQAMFMALQTDRLRLRFFGGPSYFRVNQDAVSNIRYDQVFQVFNTGNSVDITEFDSLEVEGTGWGFHGGADVSVFFHRIFGLGGFARFSRASVDLENTIALSSNDEEIRNVKAGGFQLGGGVRLKF
jgi:hypothetical protein